MTMDHSSNRSKSSSSSSSSDSKERIMAISKKSGNQTCADCPARHPTWASFLSLDEDDDNQTQLAVLCCQQCAQLHRSELGSKRCKVKHARLKHEWSSENIEALEQSGNNKVNTSYEATLTRDDFDKNKVLSDQEQESKRRGRFIRNKYKKRSYYMYKPNQNPEEISEEESSQREKRHSKESRGSRKKISSDKDESLRESKTRSRQDRLSDSSKDDSRKSTKDRSSRSAASTTRGGDRKSRHSVSPHDNKRERHSDADAKSSSPLRSSRRSSPCNGKSLSPSSSPTRRVREERTLAKEERALRNSSKQQTGSSSMRRSTNRLSASPRRSGSSKQVFPEQTPRMQKPQRRRSTSPVGSNTKTKANANSKQSKAKTPASLSPRRLRADPRRTNPKDQAEKGQVQMVEPTNESIVDPTKMEALLGRQQQVKDGLANVTTLRDAVSMEKANHNKKGGPDLDNWMANHLKTVGSTRASLVLLAEKRRVSPTTSPKMKKLVMKQQMVASDLQAMVIDLQ